MYSVTGDAGKNVIDSLTGDSNDIAKYIVEFAFGDIFSRSKLSLQQREMIILTASVVQGDTLNQLIVHINGALNVGLTEGDIIETFVQCIPYVGFPRVNNVVAVAQEIFETRNSGAN